MSEEDQHDFSDSDDDDDSGVREAQKAANAPEARDGDNYTTMSQAFMTALLSQDATNLLGEQNGPKNGKRIRQDKVHCLACLSDDTVPDDMKKKLRFPAYQKQYILDPYHSQSSRFNRAKQMPPQKQRQLLSLSCLSGESRASGRPCRG